MKDHLIEQTVHVSHYGKNVVGRPYRGEDGGWYRNDVYFSDSDPTKAIHERRFAAGANDQSPQVSTYGEHANASYISGCSCCWLGFSHTLELHNRAKGEAI